MSENVKGASMGERSSINEIEEMRNVASKVINNINLVEVNRFFGKVERNFEQRRLVIAICRACVLPNVSETDCFANISKYAEREENMVRACLGFPMFNIIEDVSKKRHICEEVIDYDAFRTALVYRSLLSENLDKLILAIECGYIVLSELICCEDEKQKSAWPILEERLRSLSALRDEARKVAFL